MNEKIKNTCDLIIENRNALEKKMFWEADTNTYAVMAGLVTAANGVKADADKYKECKKILKKNAGYFSELRGLAGALVAVKMMMSEDPEAYLNGVSEVYKKLRSAHKLTASPYMVMAAINIYEHGSVESADADIEKLDDLFKALKKQHPLLVSDSDRGLLSMVSTFGLNKDEVVESIGSAYDVCKKLSIDKDSVYSMAQILALSKMSAEEKFEFVDGIIKGLAENKTRINKSHGLAAVGALSLLNIPKEQLVNDISDASSYLKGKSGFKWYNGTNRMNTVYAVLAVFLSYAKDNEALGKAISSNIAMNIAEEIIMMLIIIAVTMSSSHSSSN